MPLLQEVQAECDEGEDRRKDVARAETLAGGAQTEEFEHCPGRATVAAVGHWDDEGGDQPDDGYRDRGPASHLYHVGVEWLDVDQTKGKMLHGYEDNP